MFPCQQQQTSIGVLATKPGLNDACQAIASCLGMATDGPFVGPRDPVEDGTAAQTLSVHGDESDDEVLVNEESLPPTAVVLGNGASEQVGGIPLPIGPLVYNVAREGRSTGSDEAGILHCTWKL